MSDGLYGYCKCGRSCFEPGGVCFGCKEGRQVVLDPSEPADPVETLARHIEGMVFAFDPGDSRREEVRKLARFARALLGSGPVEAQQELPEVERLRRELKAEEETNRDAASKLIVLLPDHPDGFGVDELGPFYTVRKPTDHPDYKGRHDVGLDHVVDAIVSKFATADGNRPCGGA